MSKLIYYDCKYCNRHPAGGNPRGVGRRDLDPFGRPHGEPPGGGMIYDPFEHPRHGFDPLRPGGGLGIGGPQLPRYVVFYL